MKTIGYAFAITLSLASCTATRAQLPPADDAFAAMVLAERDFAADAQAHGTSAAFRNSAAPDAIQLRPDPVPANQAGDNSGPAMDLVWWPDAAGMARSGDLGFTSGPYVAGLEARHVHGFFLTIWRRQPDGEWQWVLDHGLPPVSGPQPVPTVAITRLAPGHPGVTPDIAVVDAGVNRAVAERGEVALLAWVERDTRLMRRGASPATDAKTVRTLLISRTEGLAATLLGQGTSADGDYAYTYGGTVNSAKRRGAYVRVWRRTPSGWRLIVDEMT